MTVLGNDTQGVTEGPADSVLLSGVRGLAWYEPKDALFYTTGNVLMMYDRPAAKVSLFLEVILASL
jgi:hypothetical protein